MSSGSPGPATAAMTPLRPFVNDDELKRFARAFLRERLASLKKDMMHCLQEPFAPFPAILYSLSTVDLLGALYKGEATRYDATGKPTKTIQNSKDYMKDMMQYSDEQATLIMDIFRHKLVHLAQPKAVVQSKGGKNVSWRYYHDNRGKHLLLEDAEPGAKLVIKTGWEIKIDHVFNIGILQLVEDLEESIYRHGGYLDQVESDATKSMLKKMENALVAIYSTSS